MCNKASSLTGRWPTNAFLLQTSARLVVIDPGTDPEQTALIRDVLDARLDENDDIQLSYWNNVSFRQLSRCAI